MLKYHKIDYYKFSELFKILFYKIGLKCQLFCEEFILHFGFKNNSPAILSQNGYSQEFVSLQLRTDHDIANILLNKKVKLFGHVYDLNYYLQDPITLKMWPSDVFFDKSKTKLCGYGDVKYILELNKLNHLVEAAKLYYTIKDEKFISYIDIELTKWQIEVRYERSVANKIIMDIAFRSINLIFVSVLCRENKYFQEKIYPIIHNLLKLYERQIRKFSTPKWYKTDNGANHVIGEMVGIIILQKWIAHIELTKVREDCIKQEYEWLYATLDKLITNSGVYLENSANYSRLVAEFLVALDIFEAYFNGTNKLLRNKYLIPLLNYVASLSYNGTLPNFGDNDGATVLLPFKKDFTDISPLLEYRKILEAPLPDIKQFQNDGHFLWKSVSYPEISMFIRFGKWSIFRPGANSHLHCDLLSIILFARGNPIFVDKGCYLYNQSQSIRKICQSTASHNTISFKGIEQADYYDGWFNFPESACQQTVSPDNIISCYVKYKDVIHNRNIFYKSKEMIIKDEINSITRPATLNYILHESITPLKINDTHIVLTLKTGDKINVFFSGVCMNIVRTEYYPQYANICQTYALTGNIVENIIETKILFE